jgi:TRAP-type mannitol/chloroaromatic compound transport system permease small subunit
MKQLLRISANIDALTALIGRSVAWLVPVIAIIAATNAIVRKGLDTSSNALLEVQWWGFAICFLLAAPWTLAQNGHIRIDVVSTRLSQPTRSWIDLLGHLLFLLPVAAVILATGWHFFTTAWSQNEQGLNAGGLPQWPIKAVIPTAFALLLLQGASEIIKRVAIMRGELPEPTERTPAIPHPDR